MFKFVIVIIVVFVLAYVSFFVPLGDKTIFQHFVAISNTDAAKELEDGIRSKAGEIQSEVVQGIPEITKAKNKSGKADSDKDKPAKKNLKKDVPESTDEKPASKIKKEQQSDPLSKLSLEDKAALIKLLKEKK